MADFGLLSDVSKGLRNEETENEDQFKGFGTDEKDLSVSAEPFGFGADVELENAQEGEGTVKVPAAASSGDGDAVQNPEFGFKTAGIAAVGVQRMVDQAALSEFATDFLGEKEAKLRQKKEEFEAEEKVRIADEASQKAALAMQKEAAAATAKKAEGSKRTVSTKGKGKRESKKKKTKTSKKKDKSSHAVKMSGKEGARAGFLSAVESLAEHQDNSSLAPPDLSLNIRVAGYIVEVKAMMQAELLIKKEQHK